MTDRIDQLEKQLDEMRTQFTDMQEQLKSFAADAWDSAEETFEDGRQGAEKMLKRGKKHLRNAWQESKSTACDWADSADDYVRSHPWTVAAVIGGIALAAAVIYRTAESDSERRFLSRWR